MIVINPNSLAGSISASSVASAELNAPTLQKGEIYVCAKFGTEWQGFYFRYR